MSENWVLKSNKNWFLIIEWVTYLMLRFSSLVYLLSPGSYTWPLPSEVWSGPTPVPAPWSEPWGTPPGHPSPALSFWDYLCSGVNQSSQDPEPQLMVHLNLRGVDSESRPLPPPGKVRNRQNMSEEKIFLPQIWHQETKGCRHCADVQNAKQLKFVYDFRLYFPRGEIIFHRPAHKDSS